MLHKFAYNTHGVGLYRLSLTIGTVCKRRLYSIERCVPVKLSYSIYENQQDVKRLPIVIMHGLFGAKQNWKTIAKTFAQTGRQVITLDLRNHGDSPHSDVMTFDAMATDITALLDELDMERVVLMGHSLGGKVAMTVALCMPDRVGRLVVIDVAPVRISQSDTNLTYARALHRVQLKPGASLPDNRKYADSQVRTTIQDAGVRGFVLTNLVKTDNVIHWRLNLQAIIDNYAEISTFPDTSATYQKPTKFITGEHSNYISESTRPVIQRLFPNSDVEVVANAGHWVHADRPNEVIRIVNDFLHETE